jgi:mono/diheme cytochrome c family protein
MIPRWLPPVFATVLMVLPARAAEQPVALKDASGRALVEQNCAACHSLDYVRTNAPFMNQQVWTAEVNKMINVFGAPIPAEDAKAIIEYLVANYGKSG